MTISDERTEQLDIFCRVTDFTSDFLSFVDVEFIRFFSRSPSIDTIQGGSLFWPAFKYLHAFHSTNIISFFM